MHYLTSLIIPNDICILIITTIFLILCSNVFSETSLGGILFLHRQYFGFLIMSFCPSMCPSVHLYVLLSTFMSFCPSICLLILFIVSWLGNPKGVQKEAEGQLLASYIIILDFTDTSNHGDLKWKNCALCSLLG